MNRRASRKPTPAQAKALQAAADGKLMYGGLGGFYVRSPPPNVGPSSVRSSTAYALLDRGWIRYHPRGFDVVPVELTEAGADALASSRGAIVSEVMADFIQRGDGTCWARVWGEKEWREISHEQMVAAARAQDRKDALAARAGADQGEGDPDA